MTTTNDLGGLTWAGLFSFLQKEYGAESFAHFLKEVHATGRYGDLFTVERMSEIGVFAELEQMGLQSVAAAMREALCHQWEVPCPLHEHASDKWRAEWKAEVEAKRKAFVDSPQGNAGS